MSQKELAAVVIGRNEGERLHRCLKSINKYAVLVVYVDSGSTDISVSIARDIGCEVIDLDMTTPFTAARARNAGFSRVRELAPDISYVQFVDGDCEVVDGWTSKAATALDLSPNVAVVCGRRRERFPDHSIYNMLCDIEWDTPVGETKACGGDALMRVKALDMVNGYRDDLIAGEEPELCVRLRAAGWRILRLDEEMTLHDAAITRFWQWWRRAVRCGHAYAEGVFLHGASPERHWIRESRSAWFWGAGVPLLVMVLALTAGPIGLFLLLIYPFQILRLAWVGTRSVRENWWYAIFLVIGKFPEAIGQMKFFVRHYLGGETRLIEYK